MISLFRWCWTHVLKVPPARGRESHLVGIVRPCHRFNMVRLILLSFVVLSCAACSVTEHRPEPASTTHNPFIRTVSNESKDTYQEGESAPSDSDLTARVSPKKPWGDVTISTKSKSRPWWSSVLLWVPNRVLDFIDIFRVDVGAGSAFGAVGRITKYGQFGYRQIAPLSVRVGLMGRRLPVMVEHSSEFGIGPGFVASHDRKVCKGEIGLGADLLVGAYLGICTEEVLDFVAGIFFLDVSGDDLHT